MHWIVVSQHAKVLLTLKDEGVQSSFIRHISHKRLGALHHAGILAQPHTYTRCPQISRLLPLQCLKLVLHSLKGEQKLAHLGSGVRHTIRYLATYFNFNLLQLHYMRLQSRFNTIQPPRSLLYIPINLGETILKLLYLFLLHF